METFIPKTAADKDHDIQGRSEATWYERKRARLPRLHVALDAVFARLDVELDEAKRERLQQIGAALSIGQRHECELSPEGLAAQLRIIEGL